MHHVFYALFNNRGEADAAMHEIQRLNTSEPVDTIVHARPLEADKLLLSESSSYRRMMQGVLVGGVLGALLCAFVLAPLGVIRDAETPAVLLSALVGALSCGLGGALMGSSSPDPHLDRLAHAMRRGKVILTVDVPGKNAEERAMEIVRAHGAAIEPHGSW